MTEGLEIGGGGATLPEVETEDQPKSFLDFKVTIRLLGKHGYVEDCDGCEGSIVGKCRQHTKVCRERL